MGPKKKKKENEKHFEKGTTQGLEKLGSEKNILGKKEFPILF